MAVSGVQAADIKQNLSEPILGAALELVKRAKSLAERDRVRESITALKKAIALAPNYVNAHAEYIYIKGYFLNGFDEVRAEYENLMRREPSNPVYPMALALASYHVSFAAKTSWYQRAVKLAPDNWAWLHYAKAMLAFEKESETAAAELLKYIEKDGTWSSAYSLLSFLQEKSLKRIDDAIRMI
jgi:tetratricopeptide (TPR) repeat protein